MPTKRKDNKGKVLEKGEIQRKDGTYMFRWKEIDGTRKSVYANSLNELREKEQEIYVNSKLNLTSYSKSKMKTRELVELYIGQKRVKVTTMEKYKSLMSMLDKIGIMDVNICDIKTSIAKNYMILLRESGYSYGTIQNVKGFLTPAFQMAVEDDYIIKNPFNFRLCNLIDDDRKEKRALSIEEEETYLEFVKSHGWFSHSYADIVILLNTGLRVSELYGLTFNDIDFKTNRINVNKQLHYIDGEYVILSPKSKAGNRVLAMSKEVRRVLVKKYTEPRPPIEYAVDGYSGFIFLTKDGTLKTRKNLQITMSNIVKKAKELGVGDYTGVTPHVLRHTFCTRMIESGMDVKTLQIIMGHSDIGTTLNVYTHKNPEEVAKTMEKLIFANARNA